MLRMKPTTLDMLMPDKYSTTELWPGLIELFLLSFKDCFIKFCICYSFLGKCSSSFHLKREETKDVFISRNSLKLYNFMCAESINEPL